MIKFTKIESDSVEIIIKNLRFEIGLDPSKDVIAYQVHKIDAALIMKALEKSLE